MLVVPPGASLRAGSPVVLDVDPHQPSLAAAAVAAIVGSALQSPLRLVSVITSGIRRRPPNGWQIYDATRRVTSVAALAAASPLDVEFEERSGRPRAQLERAARDCGAALLTVTRESRRDKRNAIALAARSSHPVLLVAPGPETPSLAGDGWYL